MYTSANCLSFISLMSAPAAKAFSDPVRTTHRTESSVEKDRRAALSSWNRVELSAVCVQSGGECQVEGLCPSGAGDVDGPLRAFGRLSVIWETPSAGFETRIEV